MNDHVTPTLRHAADAVSAVGILSAWVGILQPIVALLVTLLGGGWYALQMYGFVKDRQARKKALRRRASDD